MPPSMCVLNSSGRFIATNQGKADPIAEWLEKQYNSGNHSNQGQIGPTLCRGEPLECEISKDEVDVAIGRLRNGRASGPDEVPAEILNMQADRKSV